MADYIVKLIKNEYKDLIGTEGYKTYVGKPIPDSILNLYGYYQKGIGIIMPDISVHVPLDKQYIKNFKQQANRQSYFLYSYNGISLITELNNYDGTPLKPIGLKENDKQLYFSIKNNYVWGETIKLNEIDILTGNYFKYEDDTIIYLKDVEMEQEPIITCSLGEGNEFYLNHSIKSFDITVQLFTKHFPKYTLTTNVFLAEEKVEIKDIYFENFNKNLIANQTIEDGCQSDDFRVKILYSDNITDIYTLEEIKSNQFVDIETFTLQLTKEYFNDEIQKAPIIYKGKVYNEQEFAVSYYEDDLIVENFTDKNKKYYLNYDENGEVPFEFNFEGLSFKRKLRQNTINENGILENKISEENVYSNNITYKLDREIDFDTSSNYIITLTNVFHRPIDYYKQSPKINLELYIVEKIGKQLNIYGEDEIRYWDNGVDTFKKPQGLTIKMLLNNGIDELDTSNDFSYYYRQIKDRELEITEGNSIISPDRLEDNKIYVYDNFYKVWGYYTVTFKEDKLVSINFTHNESVVLGDKFNNDEWAKMFIQATFLSGRKISLHELTNGKVEYKYQYSYDPTTKTQLPFIVIYNNVEYDLTNNINYIKPVIKELQLILNNTPTEYILEEEIDLTNIKIKVTYAANSVVDEETGEILWGETSEYSPELSYPQFTIYNENLTELSQTGKQIINEIKNEREEIKFIVNNEFEETQSESTYLWIGLSSITEITGIKVDKVGYSYKVGDTFLNENDDTLITINYKDSSGGSGVKRNIKLNSGFSLITTLPLKGTKFTESDSNKVIKISYVGNANIYTEYTIKVDSSFSNMVSTQQHRIVACYISQDMFPEEEKYTEYNDIIGKYILIKDTIYSSDWEIPSFSGQPTTIIDNGVRLLNSPNATDKETIKSLLDIKLRIKELSQNPGNEGLIEKAKAKDYIVGYLEDIMNTNVNARVILFDDYIAPVKNESNIVVKYPCYVEGNADKINKCKFGIMFGNNNAYNRLFVSGNQDYQNVDWHTGEISVSFESNTDLINGNLGYFEDLSYMSYGETDNKVIGYSIVSNNRLLVLKDYSDKETSIYYRTPTLVSALDSSGNTLFDLKGNNLYQEEFPLSTTNTKIGGIHANAIKNLNGDTLFISSNKDISGLDILGITGDNQRIANTRSYYIDGYLKEIDLSKAWLWTNNHDLYLILEDKIFTTNVETLKDGQYEWYQMSIPNISEIVVINNKKYLASYNGKLYRVENNYIDIEKTYIDEGDAQVRIDDKVLVLNKNKLQNIEKYKKNTFCIKNNSKNYLYQQIATLSNNTNDNPMFYINSLGENYIEFIGTDKELERFKKIFIEKEYIYFNIESYLNIGSTRVIKQYKKYKMKLYNAEATILDKDLYKIYDENDNEVDIRELKKASICYRLDKEYEITNLNYEEGSFNLKFNEEIIDVIKYADQEEKVNVMAEIRHYKPYEVYYITKPYLADNLNYFKTIWSWSFVNDVKVPNEFNITYVNNKIPYYNAKQLAKIGNSSLAFDFNKLSFTSLDFEKNIVPRVYTNNRILSNVKFICFGFKNNNSTNMILTSMSMNYTYSYPSY